MLIELGNSNYSGTFVKYCHERVEKCENFCDYGDKCDDLEGGEKACMQIRSVAFQNISSTLAKLSPKVSGFKI